jgi:hypothetical protein
MPRGKSQKTGFAFDELMGKKHEVWVGMCVFVISVMVCIIVKSADDQKGPRLNDMSAVATSRIREHISSSVSPCITHVG